MLLRVGLLLHDWCPSCLRIIFIGKSAAQASNCCVANERELCRGIALWRWVYDQGRTLPHIQPLSVTSMATIDDIGSSVNRAAWYHGLGRLSPQQVTDLILKDLGDLSSALGKNKCYFIK